MADKFDLTQFGSTPSDQPVQPVQQVQQPAEQPQENQQAAPQAQQNTTKREEIKLPVRENPEPGKEGLYSITSEMTDTGQPRAGVPDEAYEEAMKKTTFVK